MTEFELDRYGAWCATIRRVDVLGRTLFFWAVEHDHTGLARSSFSSDLDTAVAQAHAELDHRTGGGR